MIVVTSSIESLAVIERDAKDAAARGVSMQDSCRWPWDSVAGFAFKQAWVMHTEAMRQLGIATQSVAGETPSESTQRAIA